MRTSVTASILTAALITGACGGAKWPNQVASVTAATAQPVRTIDILPTDLEVWSHPGVMDDADTIRQSAEARLVGVVSETLFRRGYQVGAVLDWNGNYVGSDGTSQAALTAPQVLATVDSLASYGTIVGNARELPAPILPARLGASGADATLYLGGWGFAGKEQERGQLAGKIILGTLLVVGIVVIIVAVAAASKGKGGEALGKAAGGAARATGRVAVSVGRAALRAGTAVVDLSRPVIDIVDPLIDPAIQVAVAAPPPGPAIPARPVWSTDKSLPHSGPSKMYLEMTLVDNRSGLVLWHAHQAFPANPNHPADVMKAAKQMLASLPAS